MGGVQEMLFDRNLLSGQGSPKKYYSSPEPSSDKLCVPHREKTFVGNRLVKRRKENGL
jgi:hypothetical protein